MRYWQNELATVTEVARFPPVRHLGRKEGSSVLRRSIQGGANVCQFDLVTFLPPLSETSAETIACRARVSVVAAWPGRRPVVRDLRRFGIESEPWDSWLYRWGELRWFLESVGVQIPRVADSPDDQQRLLSLATAALAEGSLVLSAEEQEVFDLLGEESPILWPADAHVRWFTELPDAVLSGRRID